MKTTYCKNVWIFVMTLLMCLSLVDVSFCEYIKFNDFSDTSLLSINGSVTMPITDDGVVLRLTQAQSWQSGSTFSKVTLNASKFSTFFKFRITNPGGVTDGYNTKAGADGFVFVIQSISSDIGGVGGLIGYGGIDNSIAVEFDIWRNVYVGDPSTNHVGLLTNGSIEHQAGSPDVISVTPDFDNGEVWYVWIDYDGVKLEVRLSQSSTRPDEPILAKGIDVPSIIEQPAAYIGFTSGTGEGWANHDIIYWEYRDDFDPIISCPDTDEDGVPDVSDSCPNTPSGSYVNNRGCTRPFSLDLNKGWNLVGFNRDNPLPVVEALESIADQLETMWLYRNGRWQMYDPNNDLFSDLEEMTPGLGYWIKVKSACTWKL